MVACPSDEQLQRLLADQLPPTDRSPLETHIEVCPACQLHLERLTDAPPMWRESAASPIVAPALFGLHGAGLRVDGAATRQIGPGPPAAAPPADLLRLLSSSTEPGWRGRLGSYEVGEMIGAGGMGSVFRARDGRLNRVVALKLLLPQLAVSSEARLRFEREARSAAAVSHENVVAEYDVGEVNGAPFLVMQYVAGATLLQQARSGSPFSVAEIVRIGREMLAGLAAAHAQGLVHRDIKPSNILLEAATGRAMLTDFGLARAIDDVSLTASGVVAGTPMYMSPEQAEGGKIDHRSDLFSVGSVLYALSTGQPPFPAESTLAVLRQVAEATPPPIRQLNPATPAWLCRIIDRLMAKGPSQRFQTAEEVIQALDAGPAGRQRLSRKLPLAGGLPVLVGVLAMTVYRPPRDAEPGTSQSRLPTPEKSTARASAAKPPNRPNVPLVRVPDDLVAVPRQPERFVYPRPGKNRNQAKMSLDGKLVAAPSGVDTNVELFDAMTGAHLYTLVGPNEDQVREVAFSDDGTLLAGVGFYPNKPPAMRVWDLPTRKEVFTYRGEQHDHLAHLKFSPTQKLLVGFQSSPEALLYVWDARTGKEIKTVPGRCADGAFSPDAKLLAGVIGKKNAVVLWQTDTWEVLRTLPCEKMEQPDIHFSPNGSLLVAGGTTRLVVWRTDTFDKIRDFEVECCYDWFDFLGDGKTILAKSTEGFLPLHTYKCWDVITGEAKGEFVVANPRPDYYYPSLSPDRKTLLVVNYEYMDRPHLRLFDLQSAKERSGPPDAAPRK